MISEQFESPALLKQPVMNVNNFIRLCFVLVCLSLSSVSIYKELSLHHLNVINVDELSLLVVIPGYLSKHDESYSNLLSTMTTVVDINRFNSTLLASVNTSRVAEELLVSESLDTVANNDFNASSVVPSLKTLNDSAADLRFNDIRTVPINLLPRNLQVKEIIIHRQNLLQNIARTRVRPYECTGRVSLHFSGMVSSVVDSSNECLVLSYLID